MPSIRNQIKGLQALLLWFFCCALSLAAPPPLVPTKGLFLVASEKTSSPAFSRTVILLVKANKGGAMGIIINRPTPHLLGDMVEQLRETGGANNIIFEGGPVGPVQLHTLFQSESPTKDGVQILKDIYFSRSEAVLLERVQTSPASTRIYAGYAGWAAGQLESELARGGWHLMAANQEILFRNKVDDL